MEISQTTISDVEDIRYVYLKAFDNSEAKLVSNFAVNLLKENNPVKTISLTAKVNNEITGHIAFSPVFIEKMNKHVGYILAPLAVLPKFQKNNIGYSLVKHGLDTVSNIGSFIVFVYGDPKYYSRFGFKTEPAKNFITPYTLQHPEGWQALNINSNVFPKGGAIVCVESLNDSNLW